MPGSREANGHHVSGCEAKFRRTHGDIPDAVFDRMPDDIDAFAVAGFRGGIPDDFFFVAFDARAATADQLGRKIIIA